MCEHNAKYDFTELVLLALQGEITPEQMERLNAALSSDSARVQDYVELLEIYFELSSSGGVEVSPRVNNSAEEYNTFLRVLAEEERTAPECELLQEPLERELIQKVIYPPGEKRTISKFSLFMLLNTAAIFLFFVLFQFLPPKGGIEVATLTDSMNSKWADASSMVKGSRIAAGGDPLVLREGLIELQFDNQATVVMEGPARFQILAEDRIGLEYGKLYAVVPKGAIGFSVYTQQAKIIDMGTEFGVQAEFDGDTQLHVMKGKTILMAGGNADTGGIEVDNGSARRISGDTQTVTDIPFQTARFVRAFDSLHHIILREPPLLDLADIVRNGNGLGTGNSSVRLNPIRGFTYAQQVGYANAEGFLPVPELPFIDGVFVPNGRAKQIVSTRGDVFNECPETSGGFDCDVMGNPVRGILWSNSQPSTIQFYGQDYADDSGRTCIVLHANLGLTFDLDAIRSAYRCDISRFVCRVGIADFQQKESRASFYVLVDGQVRYSLLQYQERAVLNDVSVAIRKTDRFLTLAATDGGDPDNPDGDNDHRAISGDWCVFTEPVLRLE
jgi:hypothetical protein